ncbi:MAG TPA: hypothetical protein VJ508_05385, partial [Saprospiraceae bacterium]|nr:hypothetical protein [Saprospiraceae bacterium]
MTYTSRIGIWLHIYCIYVISIALSSLAAQQPISSIKNLPPGTVVTTTGTISSGNEFGQVRYMQDATAGIALYSSSLIDTKPGDSIIVTGTLSSYKGEVQISPVMSFSTIIRDRTLVETVSDNFPALQDSGYTARLVSFHCLGINSCEPVFGDGPYIAYDQIGHSAKIVIHS